MEAERYTEIYDIVSQALTLERDERAAFVNEACKGDLGLCEEVEEALAYIPEAETSGFLECSPVNIRVDEPVDELLGAVIDGYEIVEYIGGGGQGDVYRAIGTGELKTQVAVKILRAGLNADQIICGNGSEELNGTFDMMGNVWEWMESPWSSGDYLSGSRRVMRGGSFYRFAGTGGDLSSSQRDNLPYPYNENHTIGFRVASVPEPCSMVLLSVGGLILRRRIS